MDKEWIDIYRSYYKLNESSNTSNSIYTIQWKGASTATIIKYTLTTAASHLHRTMCEMGRSGIFWNFNAIMSQHYVEQAQSHLRAVLTFVCKDASVE